MPFGIVTDYEIEWESEFICFSFTAFLQQEPDAARCILQLVPLMLLFKQQLKNVRGIT
jgi:hypothetical protein